MNVGRIAFCVALSFGLLPCGVAQAGQSFDRARRHYDAAMAETDGARRIALLERSYEEHATWTAAIALGEAHLGAGRLRQAREWLDKASELGDTGEHRARALFRIGESHASEGDWLRAVDYFRAADALHDLPMIRQALHEARREAQGQVVPNEEIVETLLNSAIRGAAVRPRIDLHINFEFDSARMTRDGRAQAEELGEALLTIADRTGRSPEWLLVGHTDAQGARAYNRVLSVRRAEEVRAYLVDDFGLDPRTIDVEGRGEDELLDLETTEAAHSVNRRVEVVLVRR